MDLQFRSLRIVITERPIGKQGEMVRKTEFDRESIQEHRLTLGPGDLLRDRAWIVYFFLAAMIALAVFALIYGGAAIGAGVRLTDGAHRGVFTAAFILAFLLLWAGLSIPGAARNKKRDAVVEQRGKGNWKIVDEKNWEDFYRLLTLPKPKEEDVEER